MKILRQLSSEEMRDRNPALIQALDEGGYYCMFCDGLRVKDHVCICWQCGKGKGECEKSCLGSLMRGLIEGCD
jgi:hypothetical protein